MFLQTHATSYSFYSSVTVHCKGERRKTWQKTIPPSLWFKNPHRNLKSENSQDYAQKPQRNCKFMNSAFGHNYMFNVSSWLVQRKVRGTAGRGAGRYFCPSGWREGGGGSVWRVMKVHCKKFSGFPGPAGDGKADNLFPSSFQPSLQWSSGIYPYHGNAGGGDGFCFTLQRKSRLWIPFLGIARPQFQFLHSCVCERFLYSQDRSTYLVAEKYVDRPILEIYKSLTDIWV